MIENRAKIEKKIFLGRQAVRRSLQAKTPQVKPQVTHQAVTNIQLQTLSPIPSISTTPPPTGSDLPMSVDTDAEAAFANGSRWFFKRGHAHASPNSGSPTPQESSIQDPLRLPVIRRKWATDLLSPTAHNESSNRGGTTKPVSPSSFPTFKHGSKVPSSGFFNKLRTKSFPNLRLPFSQDSRSGKEPVVDTTAERAWSSDSSSEDDLSVDDRRNIHQASVLNFVGHLGPAKAKDEAA
jgi:hypothetical protein